ncbi:FecR family protein [Pedobacter sp. AW31-3R]|uniref:FecR family protein n=1 Tax=Pedobacter sp. AW31-3R TaxID=3445781 RepID=UPI003FA196D9
MKKEVSKALLKKYEEGKCTPEELHLLEDWYNRTAHENAGTPFTQDLFIQQKAGLEQLWPKQKKKPNHIIVLYNAYKSYGVAAVVFICASVGIYFMIAGRNDSSLGGDVDPGENKAVLTLSDGTKINVTDAKLGLLSTTSGMKVTKSSKGEVVITFLNNPGSNNAKSTDFNTIETPKGGEFKVCLPDGSNVWLNAASTLRFPTTFVYAGTRSVQLSGEAYFEIFKDKAHPFIVSTENQEVKVLGTHFNVNSYPEEVVVKTTLLEGAVLVSALGKHTALKPGQQSVNNGKTINVRSIEAENEIDWHNGSFTFNDEPLGNILNKLARWYDVKFIYKDKDLQYKSLAGSASRYAKISDILCQLELTGEVKFKIDGKEITVMK